MVAAIVLRGTQYNLSSILVDTPALSSLPNLIQKSSHLLHLHATEYQPIYRVSLATMKDITAKLTSNR